MPDSVSDRKGESAVKRPVYTALASTLLTLASALHAAQAAFVSASDIDKESNGFEFPGIKILADPFTANTGADIARPARLTLIIGTELESDAFDTSMHSLVFDRDGDLMALKDESAQDVPLPASVWLFSSGLLGLVQLGRRRQTS